MSKLATEKWEQEHRKHVSEYLEEIDRLYDDATKKLVRLGVSYKYDPETGRLFSYSDNKAKEKEAKRILAEMNAKLSAIISAGVVNEWMFANEKNDSWMRLLFKTPKKEYVLPNLDALKAFQGRKMYGHTLSQRVWHYTKQFQEQMELALSVGITEGRSAANISRDIRSYLNEPDKLFRRVRDEFGNLVLSKSAKAYHPGQGVYRSSYQNAMRTARTEINMAYRQSDMTRWRQLYFIVGYEVKTSKTHAKWLEEEWIPKFREGEAPEEICDALEGKYPKDFNFVGWHPNCKCFAIPIIANEDNKRDFWEKPLNEVKDVPEKFKQWLKDNADRLELANKRGTLPYWVIENEKYTNISAGPLNSPEKTNIINSAHEQFNAYGKEWKKEYFDERSGGYNVIHNLHQFSATNGGGEAELKVGKMLARYGKQVKFLPESGGPNKADLEFDGVKWDVKYATTTNESTIRAAIKNARKAGRAIFYFENPDVLNAIRSATAREVGRNAKAGKLNNMPDIYYIHNGVLKPIWKRNED